VKSVLHRKRFQKSRKFEVIFSPFTIKTRFLIPLADVTQYTTLLTVRCGISLTPLFPKIETKNAVQISIE
jgi:hypothetical protein